MNLQNSIVYTERNNAIQFKPTSGQTFNYFIENCLVKFDAANAGFTWDGNAKIVNSIKNEDPKFENYFTQKMNLRVKATSPAKAKGKVSTAALVPLDIVKVNRTSNLLLERINKNFELWVSRYEIISQHATRTS